MHLVQKLSICAQTFPPLAWLYNSYCCNTINNTACCNRYYINAYILYCNAFNPT